MRHDPTLPSSSERWRVETRDARLAHLRHPRRGADPRRHRPARVRARATLIQQLFGVLTMLTLAQNWNMLAGYAGLVSVGQQAFVGNRAATRCSRPSASGRTSTPVAGDPESGRLGGGSLASAIPHRLLHLPAPGRVFRHRHLGGGRGRAGSSSCNGGRLGGGTGTSLPRDAVRNLWGVEWIEATLGVRGGRGARHPRLLAGRWRSPLATIGFVYALMRSRAGLGLAAVRDNEQAAGAGGGGRRRAPAEGAGLFLRRLRHRARRRVDLHAIGPDLAGCGLLGARLDRLRHLQSS